MAVVTVSWTMSTPINSLLVPGNTQVTISGGDPGVVPQTMSVAASPAVFSAVAPEATAAPYIATVQWFDNSASPVAIGAPQTVSFSVAAPAPVLQGPGSVSVAVS
jgi:hypothetical protein